MHSLLKQAVFMFGLLLVTLKVFSSAPHITYVNPSPYKTGSAIATLSPSNTGGAVPATQYGTVSTFAGKPGVRGTADGSLTSVLFNGPWGIEHDAAGNFYVVDDQSGIVRKISTAGQVSTFAGSGSWGYSDGQQGAAQFTSPRGITIDNGGNLYVADYGNSLIRKITPGGYVSTLAGKLSTSGDAVGAGNQALFCNPLAVVADNTGNVYVTDYCNNKIKKITAAGLVTDFAGTGVIGLADGNKSEATFFYPDGIGADAAGNLFVADFGNQNLRKISVGGKVLTIAGNGHQGFADGVGSAASFSSFVDLKPDAGGNVYVSDTYNYAIRLVTPSGKVITVAGGDYGFKNGVGKLSKLSTPTGITLYKDAAYIVDGGNYVIRKMITTGYLIDKPLPAGLAFNAATGKITGTPTVESPATDYTVIAFNEEGSSETTVKIEVVKPNSTVSPVIVAKPDIKYTTPNVYIKNIAIPALAPTNTGGAVPATIYGETKVIAGTGQFGAVNGDASTAQFKLPYGISMDADGNTYIAESGGGIRMISAAGQVSSLGTDALPGPPFTVPKLNNPHGVVKDKAGNLFVANFNNHNILKITPSGTVSIFAGVLNAGTADGPGNVANIISPNGIAIDKNDYLYVSDGNNAIRQISPSGYVYTIAGQKPAGNADGQGRTAKFNHPGGLVVDNDGNIYVADEVNFAIRKITPSGFVTTIAGGTFGYADGYGTAAKFQHPVGITIDQSGNLYVTDDNNGTIRRIAPDGEVKTIAGGGPLGVESGVGTDVHFAAPDGITIGPDGNLYVAEYGKNSIKQVIATGYTIDKVLPAGLTFDPRTGIVTGTPTVLWPRTDYTVTAYNADGSSKFILSIEVDDVAAPAIGVGDVSGSITACVGSASVNYQQFSVSEINLTDDVLVLAPPNFEVSLSPGAGYGNSLIIPLADLQLPPDGDGITVYVRSASTAPVGSPTGDVVLKSAGAADVQVPVSSVIKPIVTPAITAEQKLPLGCLGQAVTFVAKPSNAGVNPVYQWYVNNIAQGANSDEFTPATINIADKVTVKLTNTSDCTTSPSVTSVPISPAFNPQITPTVIAEQKLPVDCLSQAVTFVAKPGNSGVNPVYQWYVNNTAQGGNTVEFTPVTITSTDKVTVKLTNTSDCITSPSVISAPISPAYSPQITPTVTAEQKLPAGCPGQPVTFVAKPGNAGVNPVYQWYVNNNAQGGNTIEFTPVTITATDKVTVKLTNTRDCTTSPSVTSAPVSPVYNPQITPTVTAEQKLPAGCPGQPITFVAKPGDAGTNPVYQWYVNNNAQGGNTVEFTPVTIISTDQVTVKLTNTSDCTTSPSVTSAPISPVYNPQITPTITAEQKLPVGCPDQTVTFIAKPGNAGVNPVYQWYVNNNAQGGNTIEFTPVTITATDQVTVKLTNTSDCTNQPSVTSTPISPVYNPQITPSVTAEQKTPAACPGLPVTFVAKPVSAGVNPVYQWYVNNIAQGGNNIEFMPVAITATDQVTVKLTNNSDCTNKPSVTSAPVSPAYNPQITPVVTISSPLVYPVCEGTEQTFTAAAPNAGSNPTYQWQVNGNNVGSNSNQFTSNKLKNGDVLTCTVSNLSQCVAPGISEGFNIQTNPLPTVAFNGDVFIKKGESIVLVPDVSPGVTTYSWSPSAGLNNTTIANPTAAPTVTTTYTLTVASASGCPALADIKVNVLEQMVIPNTFTPNGDGVNDTWSIPGLATYPNCRVNVYNRYGAGIFSSIGYAKNWNGSFNGYVLPAGTYYYTIDLKDGKKPLSGYVTLLK